MKTARFTLAALCLMAGSANAAIVNYISTLGMDVYAGTHGGYGDSQSILLYDETYYSNTLLASAGDTLTQYDAGCDCQVPMAYASAGAWSHLAMSADLVAGIFGASGSFGSWATGWLVGFGNIQSFMAFEITTPYAYTLDITASAGNLSNAGFWDTDPSQTVSTIGNSYDGITAHRSGILPVGLVNISLGITGNTGQHASECFEYGCPNGSFGYTLTLTPVAVPVPAAAWLFGSGLLGLVGVARRKAA